MNHRRITIYDYPEHLNPFYENNSVGDRNIGNNNKYGTWGSTSRQKIRQAILDPTWIEALNLSPAKKKFTKRWSLFKTQAVEKFQRSRSKSNSFEHTIQRPERRDTSTINIRPYRTFSERMTSASTPKRFSEGLGPNQSPVKVGQNAWTKERSQSEINTSPVEKDEKYILQGARPKLRKKRAAPIPPNSILSPDLDTSTDLEEWNMSDSIDSGIQQSPVNEELEAVLPIADKKEEHFGDKHECAQIKPLIEQPNIAALVSNNLTL